MRAALRIVLLVVLFFLVLSAVIAVARPETGVVEKVALAAVAMLLASAASVVRHRLG